MEVLKTTTISTINLKNYLYLFNRSTSSILPGYSIILKNPPKTSKLKESTYYFIWDYSCLICSSLDCKKQLSNVTCMVGLVGYNYGIMQISAR